jgi:D-lactate dehydrogenase
MTIAFFETENWEQTLFATALHEDAFTFFPASLNGDTVGEVAHADIVSTFIYSKLDAEVLSRLTSLKLIATRSAGFDHIDISYCKAHGITVCNVPAYGVNTIAEHTFALMLALSRKLIPSIERTRRGDFHLEGLRGFALAGKTLGVVGLGRIGTRVAELARAFGMKVLVSTRHQDPTKAETLGITFVDLPTILQSSDIVSLHVPLTPETRHLINTKNIQLMKKGIYLINTARGGVVETEAILWALEQGIIAGAALDVLEEECAFKEERELLTGAFLKTCDLKTQLLNHVLLTKENVIITPHNAFNSDDALREIVRTTINNIVAYTKGTPENVVNPVMK